MSVNQLIDKSTDFELNLYKLLGSLISNKTSYFIKSLYVNV